MTYGDPQHQVFQGFSSSSHSTLACCAHIKWKSYSSKSFYPLLFHADGAVSQVSYFISSSKLTCERMPEKKSLASWVSMSEIMMSYLKSRGKGQNVLPFHSVPDSTLAGPSTKKPKALHFPILLAHLTYTHWHRTPDSLEIRRSLQFRPYTRNLLKAYSNETCGFDIGLPLFPQ